MSSSIDSTFDSLPHRSDASAPPRIDLEKTVIRQGELIDHDQTGSTSIPVESLGFRTTTEYLIGQQLDHFLIESLVGTGGMGAVFRGRDLRLDRVVAIKVVPIADRGAEAMRRFRVEAQSAAKLDHPNIARVYYVGETERWSYIVFEFVEGINLRELVVKQGLLAIDDAICLTRQVAEALQHANERRVVHRDIKPSNILITQSGQAKLVDMGLARTTELDKSTNDLTASGVTLGTFDYISPEQAHDPRSADVRSDIYSLGCTLYFLLTGQPPFPDGTALQKLLMHGTKMPEDPRFFRSDISDSMIAILRKMMAKKPADRYQDPMDVIHDLQTLAQIEGLTWTNTNDIATVAPVSFQRTWFEATLPLLVSVIAIFGTTLWLHSSATFPIPREDIADRIENAPEAEPTVPANTNNANVATTVLPSTPISKPPSESAVASSASIGTETKSPTAEWMERDTIFVDPDSTIEKDKVAIVTRTMDQALELAISQPQIRRIVVKASAITMSSNASKLSQGFNGNLIIQSESSKRCRWTIEGSDAPADPSSIACFECASGQLVLQEFDIVWRPNTILRRRSLFSIKTNAWLQLKDCSVTVVQDPTPAFTPQPFDSASNAAPSLASIFLVDQPAQENTAEINPSTTTSRPIARISAQRFTVRGQCDWLRMSTPTRTDVQIENGWLAIGGSMFDITGNRTASRTSVALRIDMRHITSFTQRAWMRCTLTNAQPFPSSIVRTAKECVFTGCKSLLEWNASECQDWKVWEQSARGQDITKWIDLRGTDNVYDSLTTSSYLAVKLPNGKSEQIDLSSDANLVREERGLETIPSWKKRPQLDSNRLYETNFSAFEWMPGSFQPGFQP